MFITVICNEIAEAHISLKNDEIRRNKWPQFVQDDVEHDDIYVMNEFLCICCRNSLRQKTKDA